MAGPAADRRAVQHRPQKVHDDVYEVTLKIDARRSADEHRVPGRTRLRRPVRHPQHARGSAPAIPPRRSAAHAVPVRPPHGGRRVHDGDFPPLMLDPIDSGALYISRRRNEQSAGRCRPAGEIACSTATDLKAVRIRPSRKSQSQGGEMPAQRSDGRSTAEDAARGRRFFALGDLSVSGASSASTATIGGLTLVSRVLGFVRDMLMARFVGAGFASDAFLIAWRLPNLFRALFAEGAFSAAFVPMFNRTIARTRRRAATACPPACASPRSAVGALPGAGPFHRR